MSTHNICFSGELNKILCGYPLLSVAMDSCLQCFLFQSIMSHHLRRAEHFVFDMDSIGVGMTLSCLHNIL